MDAPQPGAEPSTAAGDTESLAAAASLFGDLLLAELDAARLGVLREPERAAALVALGVEVPTGEGEELLDELAAEFHGAFLRPADGGAPPVGSLWTEGRYEGQLAARIRELGEAAAAEFGNEAARGAPVDHLGSVLHLWALASSRAPWVADELAGQHLAWAAAPLAQAARRGGFYGQVASACGRLVACIGETRLAQA